MRFQKVFSNAIFDFCQQNGTWKTVLTVFSIENVTQNF